MRKKRIVVRDREHLLDLGFEFGIFFLGNICEYAIARMEGV